MSCNVYRCCIGVVWFTVVHVSVALIGIAYVLCVACRCLVVLCKLLLFVYLFTGFGLFRVVNKVLNSPSSTFHSDSPPILPNSS